MLHTIILTIILMISSSSFSQSQDDQWSKEVSSSGIRIVRMNADLPDDQKVAILEYDFEQHRLENKSMFIKVKDGPHLEVYSKHRLLTGQPDVPETIEKAEPGHDHTPSSDRKIKTVMVIEVDIFKISSN